MRLADKILLVGWDSAEWNVIRPLMNQGKMPHLTGLIDRGVSGNVRSLYPHHSSMLWTSIATGKRPHKTGICGYHEVAPDRLDIRPVTSYSRKPKALWNILSQSGLRAHCVNWYASDPAEPVNGIYVSRGFFSPPESPGLFQGRQVHPSQLEDQLSSLRITPDELEPASLLELFPPGTRLNQLNPARLRQCAEAMAETASVHAVACHVIQDHPFDFMTVLYTGLERFSHLLMPYHPPRQSHISEQDFNLYQHALSVVYQLHDMMLGRLMQLTGSGATVIVVSDHGFKTGLTRRDKDAASVEAAIASHESQGILVMEGPNITPDDTVEGATLLDATPTILTLLGLPIGSDMDGKPMLNAINIPLIPEIIPSWEQIKSDAWNKPGESASQIDERLRYLVDLGYSEPPTAEARQRITQTRYDNTYNLARAYLDARCIDRAIPLLESLCRIEPCREDWNKSLFETLNQVGRHADARAIVQRFWDIGERGALVHLGFALVDLSQRRPADALAHLNAISKDEVIIPDINFLVGQARLRLREWEPAETSFRAELKINPNNEAAWGALAMAAFRTHRYRSAAEYALQAVGLKPDFVMGHYYLGWSLHRLGKFEQSAQAFKRCLEIDRNFTPACRALIALYKKELNDPSQALIFSQRATSSAPSFT